MTELETKLAELIKAKGEDDGICHAMYFNEAFNNALNSEYQDLIGAFCTNDDNRICFLVTLGDDNLRDFLHFEEFDFNTQLDIVNYIENF